MSKERVPTDAILSASSALAHTLDIQVLEDWQWYDTYRVWALKVRLRIESANAELIPRETDWYALVRDVYPFGPISLYPDKSRSITLTFQHQHYNGAGDTSLPWRTGNICAETPLSYMNKQAYAEEPLDSDKRLAWRLQQARQWLRNASSGTLVDKGDAFELPDYQTGLASLTVVYYESREALPRWQALPSRYGIANLASLREPAHTVVVIAFKDLGDTLLCETPWNAYVSSMIDKTQIGVWILLPRVVVLDPWQAPMKWGELLRVAKGQGLDVRRLLSELSKRLRDGEQHLALLGFPIPERIGEQPTRIHWQALRLPILSHGKDLTPGFSRPGELTYQVRDRRLLSGPTKLDWQRSENWHENEIFNRGMLPPEVTNAKVVLVGAGALGSMVAEMLVRGGARYLTLIDPEKVEVGNLTRHTLSLRDIGLTKASALAARLSSLSPHVRVSAIEKDFSNLAADEASYIADCDVVLDTTGSDDVLHYVGAFRWSHPHIFCSVSIGLQARRLYVLTTRKTPFAIEFFLRHLRKWLTKDAKEYDGSPLPVSGGVGCWHPTFPAKAIDMWLLASTAVKYFEKRLLSGGRNARVAIFEQTWDADSYVGINLIAEESDNG